MGQGKQQILTFQQAETTNVWQFSLKNDWHNELFVKTVKMFWLIKTSVISLQGPAKLCPVFKIKTNNSFPISFWLVKTKVQQQCGNLPWSEVSASA